jgi:hypothetical protein
MKSVVRKISHNVIESRNNVVQLFKVSSKTNKWVEENKIK